MNRFLNDANFQPPPRTVNKAILGVIISLAVIFAMLFVNYRLMKAVRNSIISVVDKDLAYVVNNAALVRFLGRVSTETHFLLHAFVSNEVFNRPAKEALLNQMGSINATFLIEEAAESREVIESYVNDVHLVMGSCDELGVVLQRIRLLDKELDRHLASISEKLHEKEIALIAEGGAPDLFRRVRAVLPSCRKVAQNLAFAISRLNQLHMSPDALEDSSREDILAELDKLDTALVELSISGEIFAGSGRSLRKLVAAYREEFLAYFAILQRFPPLMASMANSLKSAIEVSERIDAKIQARSGMVKTRIEQGMNSFIMLSSVIFLLFNAISIALFFYIIKVFRISRLAESLQKALNEVKVLRGILPICAHCKNIRNDEGYWLKIETYLHERSDVDFTHGICPTCIKKLYPDLAADENSDEKMAE